MSETPPLPEMQIDDPNDLIDVIAFVQIGFAALGYSWFHPQVLAFLEKLAEITGQRITHHFHLDARCYALVGFWVARLLEDLPRSEARNPDAWDGAKEMLNDLRLLLPCTEVALAKAGNISEDLERE